ncbi:MAG: uracil-DNA glycosylase [Minisyncoccota bacterium]
MPESETLSEINARWARNCTCSLRQSATQAVPGEGNPNANMVFIGEAPGKNEDLSGKPFIGAAGKFLDTLLAEIHIPRSDVYITSIVKYRPPNNRDPLPEEIAACSPWLTEQLKSINPHLVVFLGRYSLKHFFPGEKISQVHGTLLRGSFQDVPVTHFLPLYHPAAALYNSNMRGTLLEDFKKIPLVLKKLNGKEAGITR